MVAEGAEGAPRGGRAPYGAEAARVKVYALRLKAGSCPVPATKRKKKPFVRTAFFVRLVAGTGLEPIGVAVKRSSPMDW